MGFGISKQVTISQQYTPRTTALVYSKDDTEILLKTEEPGTYLLYRDHDTDILYLSVRSVDYVEHHRINFEDNLYYMDNQPYPYLDSIVLYHQKHRLNGTKLTHHAQLSARAVKNFTMRVAGSERNGYVSSGKRQGVSFAGDDDDGVRITGIEHTNDIVLGRQRISKSSGRLWMSGMQKSMKRMSVSDSYNLLENNETVLVDNGHVFSNGHVQSYDSDSDDLDGIADQMLRDEFNNEPLLQNIKHTASYDVAAAEDDIGNSVLGTKTIISTSTEDESGDPVILFCSHL